MADNVSILQHELNRFGVVTVMDAMLYEYGSNKPVLKLDTLKVSNITMDGSTKEIRGGMAADLLLTYNHSRTINVEITDALLSLHSLKALWGSSIQDVKAIRAEENAKVDTASTMPTWVNTWVKKDGGANPVIGTDYFILNKTKDKYITEATDLAVDDELVAYGYVAVPASANAVETVLKSTTFPERLTLVGRTVFIDEATGKQVLAEIEIPKFQFGNAFDFNMDAEGDAATFNFSGVALAEGSSKELIKVKTLAKGQGLMEKAWENPFQVSNK